MEYHACIHCLLLLSGIVFSLTTATEAANDFEICYCSMDYKPVCGDDGRTYGNAECAKCSGIVKVTQGRCKDTSQLKSSDVASASKVARRVARQLEVPDEVLVRINNKNPPQAEVESRETRRRRERMERRKRGQSLTKYQSRSADACVCRAHIYKPVCANDGYTHANADCAVKCSGVKKTELGRCDVVCPACATHRYHEPVCDSTGTLYRNRCFAQCFGWSGSLTVTSTGSCDYMDK